MLLRILQTIAPKLLVHRAVSLRQRDCLVSLHLPAVRVMCTAAVLQFHQRRICLNDRMLDL